MLCQFLKSKPVGCVGRHDGLTGEFTGFCLCVCMQKENAKSVLGSPVIVHRQNSELKLFNKYTKNLTIGNMGDLIVICKFYDTAPVRFYRFLNMIY
jgi:hypothetical protein